MNLGDADITSQLVKDRDYYKQEFNDLSQFISWLFEFEIDHITYKEASDKFDEYLEQTNV